MKKKIITIIIPVFFQASIAFSSEQLNHKVILEGTVSDYRNTETEDSYTSFTTSAYISGDNYKNGYTLGYSKSNLYQANSDDSSDQHKLFLSARFHNQMTGVEGLFTNRFDLYYLNTDKLQNVDNIKIMSPQITWTSSDYKKTVNLGYTYSYYSELQNVNQLTPTVGLAVSDKNWLQLRAYLSSLTYDQAEADNKAAIEIKLTHNFKKDNADSKLNFVQLSTVLGEREYTVDPDTAIVYDSGGVQTRGVSVNSKWDLAPSHSLGVSAGNSLYQKDLQEYNSNYFSVNWEYKPTFGEKSRLLEAY